MKITINISLQLAGLIFIGLLLFAAAPEAAAKNKESSCKDVLIEDGFKKLKASDKTSEKISDLQQRLVADGFPKVEANGRLDNKTYDALEEFCKKLVPGKDLIPVTTPQSDGSELAEFLIEKLSAVKPAGPKENPDSSNANKPKSDEKPTEKDLAKADNKESSCGETLVKDGFIKLNASDKTSEKVSDLQKRLIAAGFKEVKVDGQIGELTYQALHEFCVKLVPGKDKIPVTTPQSDGSNLADFLIAKLNEIKTDPESKTPETSGKNESETGEAASSEEKPEQDEPAVPCEIPAIQQSFEEKGFEKQEIEKIQSLLKAGGYLIDRVDGEMGTETYNALARLCRFMNDAKLLEIKGDESGSVSDVLIKRLNDNPLEQTASLLQNQVSQISITAVEDCGCSRDFSSLVYGFLPYWLADGKPQTVDFSMLDRIGYHALQLDTKGNLRNDSLWGTGGKSESHIAKFIGAAHKHRVKVDITFYTSDWMDWDNQGDHNEIENAVAAIRQAYEQEFNDTSDDKDISANLVSLLRKLLPFVEDVSSQRADGINIYFDKYRNPKDAVKMINIVKAVAKELPDVELNILLGLNWAGIENELFAVLKPVLKQSSDAESNGDNESGVNQVARLFVYLPRNTDASQRITSLSKKQLRRAIEDAFDGDGETRRTVLRKTVPIILTSPEEVIPYYFDKEHEGKAGQFVDDLIYLQDNFAGVGLWPLPLMPAGEKAKGQDDIDKAALASKAPDAVPKAEKADKDTAPSEAAAIGERLVEVFGPASDSGLLWSEIEFFAQEICSFACPNRWLFRLAFDLLATLLVIYGLLAIWNCRLREIYLQKSLYFYGYGLVTAMIFAVTLICDPFWQAIADTVLVGVVLAFIGYIGIRVVRRSMQPKYP